jgi:hypothetical protein
MQGRLVVPLLAFVALVAEALPARADTFSFGAGVAVAGGYGAFGEPDPNRFTLPRSGSVVALPGFSGLTYGAGIALEARFFDFIGVEASVSYARDSLSGDVEAGDEVVSVTLSQPVFRVPILLKAVLPAPIVSPFAEIGPELVFPGLSDVEVEPEGGLRGVAAADPAVWATVGLGVEIELPIADIDLRIPAALRLSVNPSSSGELDDRATALPTDAVVFDSTPAVTIGIATGLSVFF